jgi:hypothetical protein
MPVALIARRSDGLKARARRSVPSRVIASIALSSVAASGSPFASP